MFPYEILEMIYQFSDIDTKIEISKIYGTHFKPIKIIYKNNTIDLVKIQNYKYNYTLVIYALSKL
jgi:hypothetical protein